MAAPSRIRSATNTVASCRQCFHRIAPVDPHNTQPKRCNACGSTYHGTCFERTAACVCGSRDANDAEVPRPAPLRAVSQLAPLPFQATNVVYAPKLEKQQPAKAKGQKKKEQEQEHRAPDNGASVSRPRFSFRYLSLPSVAALFDYGVSLLGAGIGRLLFIVFATMIATHVGLPLVASGFSAKHLFGSLANFEIYSWDRYVPTAIAAMLTAAATFPSIFGMFAEFRPRPRFMRGILACLVSLPIIDIAVFGLPAGPETEHPAAMPWDALGSMLNLFGPPQLLAVMIAAVICRLPIRLVAKPSGNMTLLYVNRGLQALWRLTTIAGGLYFAVVTALEFAANAPGNSWLAAVEHLRGDYFSLYFMTVNRATLGCSIGAILIATMFFAPKRISVTGTLTDTLRGIGVLGFLVLLGIAVYQSDSWRAIFTAAGVGATSALLLAPGVRVATR